MNFAAHCSWSERILKVMAGGKEKKRKNNIGKEHINSYASTGMG